MEQVAVLGDHAQRVADRVEREVADVDPRQPHRAAVDVVQPRRQRRDRGLAAAGGADERDNLAGLDAERHAVEHLGTAPGVERRDLLEGCQRDLVGRGVGEPDVVELQRHRPIGHRDRVRLLGDQRRQIEHLEDPLEADQGGHRVDPCAGQRGERRVETGEEEGERDDGSGLEPSVQREIPTEAVDEGERERRHEGESGQEDPLAHRRAHTDSATRSARATNSVSSCAGRPNSFTSVAPGAENRSVIWVVIAALWSAASRSRWARRAPMRRAGMTKGVAG